MCKHLLFFIAFFLYAPPVWGMEATSESKEGEQPPLNENEIWKEKIEYMEGVKFEDLSEEIIEEAKGLILEGKKPKVLAIKNEHLIKFVQLAKEGKALAWKVSYRVARILSRALNEAVDPLRVYLIPKDDLIYQYYIEGKEKLCPSNESLNRATNRIKLIRYLKNLKEIRFDDVQVDPYLLEYCFENIPPTCKKILFVGARFAFPPLCRELIEKFIKQHPSVKVEGGVLNTLFVTTPGGRLPGVKFS